MHAVAGPCFDGLNLDPLPSELAGILTFLLVCACCSRSSGFLLGLASDYVTNRLDVNEAKRATQLKELITALGPVFIKVHDHEHTCSLCM